MTTFKQDEPEVISKGERKQMSDKLVETLKDAGFKVVEGFADLKKAIQEIGDNSTERLCSGFGVFPDGTMCSGCLDCNEKKKESK